MSRMASAEAYPAQFIIENVVGAGGTTGVTFASNQNGVRNPKCSDASGDFRDLSVGVRK